MNFKMNTVIIACLALYVTADQGLNRLWNEEWNKTAPQIQCVENLQYAHDGRCCTNCDAGTYVKKPCAKALEVGSCAPCEPGTYTEHATGMNRCLTCTSCHMDQEETLPCTKTQNRQCQCRRGSFCETDKPCEVCKKCVKCKEDEEKVRNCTTTSNAKCRKKRYPDLPNTTPPVTPTTSPPTSTVLVATIVPVLVLVLVLVSFGVGLYYWRRNRSGERTESPRDTSESVMINMVSAAEEAQGDRSTGKEEPQQESQPLLQETQAVHAKSMPVEDEDKGLGDSLPNTTTSSQTSLSALPTVPSCGSSPRHSPAPRRLPLNREGIRLIPSNSIQSLKESLDLFGEFLERRVYKRFFRAIGLSDNKIEDVHDEDKVYDLLKDWMQKKGHEADINYLLDKLRELDQNHSAESISQRAVQKGLYTYADRGN